MPIHDWTTVGLRVFRGFRLLWIVKLCEGFNNGGLGDDYYSLSQLPNGRGQIVIKRLPDHRVVAMIDIDLSMSKVVPPKTELGRLTINFASPECCDRPISVTSMSTGAAPVLFVEHLAVGDAIPDMPLFLDPGYYINIPLQSTYDAAFHGMPGYLRKEMKEALPG